MISIERLTAATDQAAHDLSALLTTLSNEPYVLSKHRLDAVIASPTEILVAKEGETIVGVVVLTIAPQLKVTKAWLEEVVVNPDYRGRGIAKQLVGAVIDAARAAQVSSLNLTSNPTRMAARALYERMGFVQRDTDVYCMKF